MAFRTKGWRKIVVKDHVYFWQRDDEREHFDVRPEREPHRLLTVTCDCCGEHVGGFYRGVKPGSVRSAIEFALSEEWLGERPQMQLITFGVSLRFVTIRSSWLTSTVLQLARSIDEDHAFDRMPILADALQDAGCENTDILGHCRSERSHGMLNNYLHLLKIGSYRHPDIQTDATVHVRRFNAVTRESVSRGRRAGWRR